MVITSKILEAFSQRGCVATLHVQSPEESQALIGEGGAEGLLGEGDLLLRRPFEPPTRVQAPATPTGETVEKVGNTFHLVCIHHGSPSPTGRMQITGRDVRAWGKAGYLKRSKK